MSEVVCTGQNRKSDLDLELKEFVSHLTWMLGTEFTSSGRAVHYH